MTYFNRPWVDSLRLDDGTVVSSASQLEAYLREHDLSLSADYSAAWRQKAECRKAARHRKELFADFLFHYKRSIWNAKSKKHFFRRDCR